MKNISLGVKSSKLLTDFIDGSFKRRSLLPYGKFKPHKNKRFFKAINVLFEIDSEGREIPIKASRAKNARFGLIKMTVPILAGWFKGIYNELGAEEFSDQLSNYFSDYRNFSVPCDPTELVTSLEKNLGEDLSATIKWPEVPDKEEVSFSKLLEKWEKNLKNNNLWCEKLKNIGWSLSIDMREKLESLSNMSRKKMRGLINNRNVWRNDHAEFALYWCISTGTHPLRFLNYAGLWITNYGNQPKDFRYEHPVTDPEKVEYYDKQGKHVFSEVAKARFHGAFFISFVNLLGKIKWQDEKGQEHRMVSENFVFSMSNIVWEDLLELGISSWVMVTGYESSERAAKRYKELGYLYENTSVLAEIVTKEVKSKIEVIQKSSKEKEKVVTGNPIFDSDND